MYWGGILTIPQIPPTDITIGPHKYIRDVYTRLETEGITAWPWHGVNIHIHDPRRPLWSVKDFFDTLRSWMLQKKDRREIIVGEWGVTVEESCANQEALGDLYEDIRSHVDKMFYFNHAAGPLPNGNWSLIYNYPVNGLATPSLPQPAPPRPGASSLYHPFRSALGAASAPTSLTVSPRDCGFPENISGLTVFHRANNVVSAQGLVESWPAAVAIQHPPPALTPPDVDHRPQFVAATAPDAPVGWDLFRDPPPIGRYPHPCVRFAAPGGVITPLAGYAAVANEPWIIAAEAHTIFVVFRERLTNLPAEFETPGFGLLLGDADRSSLGLELQRKDGVLRFATWGSADAGQTRRVHRCEQSLATGVVYIGESVHAAGRLYAFVNGFQGTLERVYTSAGLTEQRAATSASVGNLSIAPGYELALHDATLYHETDIFEVLLYDKALNEEQARAVRLFLAQRYGVPPSSLFGGVIV
jgi:hypothetical protein